MQACTMLLLAAVWQISVVCKHVWKLDTVLTAAAPGLEQRFDADLKEDRILQAQHGGFLVLSVALSLSQQ